MATTYDWDICQDHPVFIVIPPYRSFHGPVGALEQCYARSNDNYARMHAANVQRKATMERVHFLDTHKPFNCSAPDCDAWFEEPEEYTTHVIENNHDQYNKLPEAHESAFVENNKRFERLQNHITDVLRSLQKWWGRKGSETRKVAERKFIHQLEHDPLYAYDGPMAKHPHMVDLSRSLSYVDKWGID